MIQKAELTPDAPTPQDVLDMLFQSMREPSSDRRQKGHRPAHLQFEDASLGQALAPELEKLGIGVAHQPLPEVVDGLVADLELHMRGRPEHPGLLSVKGVTPELVGGMFAAAAEFYRAAPWVQLSDRHTLAVRVPPERKPRFVQVMGNAGVEYGLAMYRKWEHVERMVHATRDPRDAIPPQGMHSFFFDDVSKMPFDDLEAIQHYGWEVAGRDGYPTAYIVTRRGEARRPSRADLVWYEAALRAIPRFLRDHLQPGPAGDYLPAEVEFSVPTHAGETNVHVKYLAGALPTEARPVRQPDWSQLAEEDI
jgi:hypothetical protein